MRGRCMSHWRLRIDHRTDASTIFLRFAFTSLSSSHSPAHGTLKTAYGCNSLDYHSTHPKSNFKCFYRYKAIDLFGGIPVQSHHADTDRYSDNRYSSGRAPPERTTMLQSFPNESWAVFAVGFPLFPLRWLSLAANPLSLNNPANFHRVGYKQSSAHNFVLVPFTVLISFATSHSSLQIRSRFLPRVGSRLGWKLVHEFNSSRQAPERGESFC